MTALPKASGKRKAKAAPEPTVIGVKGFDKNLQCLGYQFTIGKTHEYDGEIAMCESGFHCIDGNPLDVLDYYPLIAGDGSLNRFASVIAHGEVKRDGSSKIVTGKLTVSAELKIPDLISSAVKFVMDACKGKPGDDIQAASGNSSKLAASGDSSKLAASGNSSQLAASGYFSKLAASGNSSKLAASGYYSQLAASGKNSVIAAAAPDCTATGADGTWISLAEFDRNGKCIGFATGCIGRDGLKPNTAYVAKGGKLVEVA
jgi:hypothetical protein